MFKLLNKKKNNKGFTLVELVIVVAILAILVGILAPQYTKYVERSRKSADAANLENIVSAVKVAAADQAFAAMIPTTADAEVKISISNTGTKITYNKTEIAADTGSTATGGGALYAALKEYAGDAWANTTLKSKSWAGTTANTIVATCKIKTSGAVEVSYDPANVKNNVKED